MNKLSKNINLLISGILFSTLSLSCVQASELSKKDFSKTYTEAAYNQVKSLPDASSTNTIKKGTVNANSLNMRAGASTKHKVLLKLKKGEVVTINETKGDWCKVTTKNNKQGWVSKKYLNIKTVSSNAKPDASTSKKPKETKATVTASTLNVRSGAGTNYSVIAKVKKNNTVTVLDKKGSWSKIKVSNNKTGWVSNQYIKTKTSTSTSNANTSSNATSSNSNTNVSNQNNVTVGTSNTTVSNQNKEKDLIIKDLLLTEGSVSSSQVTTLKENLYKLPTKLLQKVKDMNIKVLITSKNISNYYDGTVSGTITGLFDPMADRIYISNNPSHINKSTVHEFGHALDLILGKSNYITLSNEWVSIYKSESHTASSSYYKANAQEYFADAFNRYINNPSSLKSSAPKTYNYIKSAINNL